MRDGVFFTSGQIGLVPASMMLAQTVEEEIAWSLQSLYRITVVHQKQDDDGVVICYLLTAEWKDKVQFAWTSMKQDLMLGKVDFLVVHLLPGSQLPRSANVEWQFIAASADSAVQIRTTTEETTEPQIAFCTTESSGSSASIQVQDIELNGKETSFAAVCFADRAQQHI